MNIKNTQLKLFFRVLTPAIITSILLWIRFRCFVSPKSEVEIDNLNIGKGTRISSFCKIKSRRGKLTIGRNVDIAVGCFISASEKGIRIGNDVLIGPNSAILSGRHNYSDINKLIRVQGGTSIGTSIEDNVFIGAGTVIVDGSKIGTGSVIAANSLVSGKIPENSVVTGNPAKVIFKRR